MKALKIDRKSLKKNSLAAIHDGKTSIVVIGLVFIVLLLILELLSMRVSGEWEMLKTMAASVMEGGELVLPETESSFAAEFLVLALDVMGMMLSVGFVIACLNTSRRVAASVGNLFDGFAMLLRALAVVILRSVLLSLWAMIYALPVSFLMTKGGFWSAYAPLVCLPLLFPALRAFYGYRQAVYLMLDNPHLNGMQCLKASTQLMEGRKWELFVLDLSFLGWYLLCLIPLVTVWVLPFTNVCYAGFYDGIMEQYAADHKFPQPDEPDDIDDGWGGGEE